MCNKLARGSPTGPLNPAFCGDGKNPGSGGNALRWVHYLNTPGGQIYAERKYLTRYLHSMSVRDRFLP